MPKICVVDSIPGSGKTSAAVNYILDSPRDQKFIFITPYNEEAQRVSKLCASRDFETTAIDEDDYEDEYGRKLPPKITLLKNALHNGRNITTTHALFGFFDDEVIDLCKKKHYYLIMDEVADVVTPCKIYNVDKPTLLEKYVDIGENGHVTWREGEMEYDGDLQRSKNIILYNYVMTQNGGKEMYNVFPVDVFNGFDKIIILTYMFDAQIQRYYYDSYHMEYEYYYAARDKNGKYVFKQGHEPAGSDEDYSKLITVLEDRKLNSIGNKKHALSKRWYQDHLADQEKQKKEDKRRCKNISKAKAKMLAGKDKEEEKKNKVLTPEAIELKNDFKNFFKHKAKVETDDGRLIAPKTGDVIWTVFGNWEDYMTRKSGYSSGFVPCNARASNDWGKRQCVAYMVNRFMNPNIITFFANQGIKVDQERYALSEMLQFIWRSAIRNHHHITIYVPSARMRKLLKEWIKEHSGRETK